MDNFAPPAIIDDVKIGRASVDDADDYVKYMNTIGGESEFLAFGAGEYSRNQQQTAQLIDEISSSENQLFLIARHKGQIVGALMLQASPKPRLRHRAELSVTVRRSFWSKGLATVLCQQGLQIFVAAKVVLKVELQVRQDHHRAVDLYRRLGFQEEGRISAGLITNGRAHDILLMSKHLHQAGEGGFK
ncbi:GNAT family N-acetyltransferase [Caulobacter sp. S45]|uniref:GNAT family N-acetyltransferase n=1 Tax=Caulobacter sp. S45 TaxID=1641861 RepID=UPI00131DE5B3|nr:GNAT family N-acetyltransferase [Caulobacter sp. S45]